MNIVEIIAQKRDGHILSAEAIRYAISGYSRGAIPDYQMAALLMAIYLKGMNSTESVILMQAMLHSGERIDLSDLAGAKIDKHSTGGVGDKVSLILAPLMAAAGINVPMISGRGLGHTGGTLDKLESIPGFRSNLSVAEFKKQLREIGVVIAGQTDHLVPADKKIYALREATATIASLPLIIASILSKKLAEGINGLVLDIKTGSGAFMKNLMQAEELAIGLVHTAKQSGLAAKALLTRMDQPLGYSVGNWLEVVEVMDAFQGKGAEDLMEVTYALGEAMLQLAGSSQTRADLKDLLVRGEALKKFYAMVQAQDGDIRYLLDPGRYKSSKYQESVKSQTTGFITSIDAWAIGDAAVHLGAGRFRMEDPIDPKAGIWLLKKCNDEVQIDEELAVLYSDDPAAIANAKERIGKAFIIKDQRCQRSALVVKKID